MRREAQLAGEYNWSIRALKHVCATYGAHDHPIRITHTAQNFAPSGNSTVTPIDRANSQNSCAVKSLKQKKGRRKSGFRST